LGLRRAAAVDAMISSLEDHLRAPVTEAQAVYRALAAPGVYQELVGDSTLFDPRRVRARRASNNLLRDTVGYGRRELA
jgi:hypothetical protein